MGPRKLMHFFFPITRDLCVIKPLDAIKPFEWFNYPGGPCFRRVKSRAYIFIRAGLQKQTHLATSALMHGPTVPTPCTQRHPSVVRTQQPPIFFALCRVGSGFYPHSSSFISPDPITDKRGRGGKIRPLFGVVPEASVCSSTQTIV